MRTHIGQVIMSTTLNTAAKVHAIYGGTWEAWGQGRVPVGVDPNDADFNAPNKTGGSKTVTLTAAQMPKHYLTVPHIAYMENSYSVSNGTHTTGSPVSSEHEGAQASISGNRDSHKFSFGSGSAHNNLQPYKTIYYWLRKA